jgi:hypothetical protein
MTNSLSRAISAPDLPAAGLGEKLNWDAFSARYFPGRPRHDLNAVAAYGTYKQGRDWRNGGPQTKVGAEADARAERAGSHGRSRIAPSSPGAAARRGGGGAGRFYLLIGHALVGQAVAASR